MSLNVLFADVNILSLLQSLRLGPKFLILGLNLCGGLSLAS